MLCAPMTMLFRTWQAHLTSLSLVVKEIQIDYLLSRLRSRSRYCTRVDPHLYSRPRLVTNII